MNKKTCTSCNLEKNISNFYASGKLKNGSKKYRATCKNCDSQYLKLDKARFNRVKRSARDRKIKFELSFDDFLTFKSKSCNYCNTKLDCIRIDRIDSKGHYTLQNSVACCFVCNTMKSDLLVNEFYSHIEKILKNKSGIHNE